MRLQNLRNLSTRHRHRKRGRRMRCRRSNWRSWVDCWVKVVNTFCKKKCVSVVLGFHSCMSRRFYNYSTPYLLNNELVISQSLQGRTFLAIMLFLIFSPGLVERNMSSNPLHTCTSSTLTMFWVAFYICHGTKSTASEKATKNRLFFTLSAKKVKNAIVKTDDFTWSSMT